MYDEKVSGITKVFRFLTSEDQNLCSIKMSWIHEPTQSSASAAL